MKKQFRTLRKRNDKLVKKSSTRLWEATDEDFSIGLDLFLDNPFIKPRDEFVDPSNAALLLSFGVGLDSSDRTTEEAIGP